MKHNDHIFTAPNHSTIHTFCAWMIGASLSALLIYSLYHIGIMRFANNDDAYILRAFMTAVEGKMVPYNMILHPLLSYPLAWLGTLAPNIAWFSIMQIVFLWLAITVIVKSLMMLSYQNSARYGTVLGLALSLAFCAVFGLKYCALITFTVTAALLGAAAVIHLLSVDMGSASNGKILRNGAFSLTLLGLAYGLRQISVVPVLVFCVIAFLLQWWRRCKAAGSACVDRVTLRQIKRRVCHRPMLIVVVMVLVVVGALVAWRELDTRAQGAQEYIRWQDASSNVLDYASINHLPQELLDEIGWSEAQRALVNDWYFIDRSISTSAFDKITAYHGTQNNSSFAATVARGVYQVGLLMQKERALRESVWFLCGLWLLCAVGLIIKRKNTRIQWLALLATLLCTAALLVYLGVAGRLPLRAALSVLLPAAGMVFGLLPSCIGASFVNLKCAMLLILLAVVCLVPATLSTITVVGDISPASVLEEEEGLNAYADLDEYAAENPEQLFITDMTMVMDSRMFPAALENGLPANVVNWGGWGARSPLYMAQLASFELDGANLDATLFLNENVRLARGMIDPPPQKLLDYLTELAGDGVDYAFDADWGGVHILQLYQ